MVATWPERGQQAPDYWDGQLKAYVDEMQTLPSRLGDLGLPASGTELSASYEHKVDRTSATTGQVPTLQGDGTLAFEDVSGGGGAGDVTGPASSTNDSIAVFDGTTGKVVKDGGKTLAELATAAQGALADTAVQPDDLGTAAAQDSTAFATAAQGAKADSAVQPGSLATVATSGAYSDLSGKPTLGDAAAKNTGTTTGTVAAGDDSRLVDNAKSVGGGKEKVAALSATTGTATGDLSAASIFTVTPTGNITLAFSNIPASGTSCTVTVIVSQGATVRTVTMPSGTKWMGMSAPTQVASKVCVFTLLTVDGGTTWLASAGVES